MSNDEVVTVAVLGVTGAGKSTFVQRVTQDDSIVIGHSLRAETRTTASYKFDHNGTRYEIVDCPGFNDTLRPDSEILEDIVAWLHKSHGEGRLLSGIIYLHRISDTRVQGTTMTQFQVLQALCGDDFYGNLVLGTTFWSKVSEGVGRTREANLLEVKHFFGDMRDMGARYVRIPDDREGCLAILEATSSNQRRQLQVQGERAEGKSFKDTTAFRTLAAAQANSSAFASVLWLKLSGYLILFLVVAGNLATYILTQLSSWCKLGLQSVRHQWDLHRRLQAEKAGVRSQFEQQDSKFAPLREAARAMQRQLRQLQREESAAERALRQEAARRKTALAEEKRKAAEQERRRRWLVAHAEWESQRDEALRQFGIRASRKKMESRSGHMLTFVNCDQPGCGSALWMDYYKKCGECSMRWCMSCRKQGRLVHTTSCSSSSEYGGLTREEALRECFQEAEPKLDEPLTPAQSVAVLVFWVIILVYFRHQLWPLARFVLWAPVALSWLALAVFLQVLRGMAWVVSVVAQMAFYAGCYALGLAIGLVWLVLQAAYYLTASALWLVSSSAWLVLQLIYFLSACAFGAVLLTAGAAVWLLSMAIWAAWYAAGFALGLVLLPFYLVLLPLL